MIKTIFIIGLVALELWAWKINGETRLWEKGSVRGKFLKPEKWERFSGQGWNNLSYTINSNRLNYDLNNKISLYTNSHESVHTVEGKKETREGVLPPPQMTWIVSRKRMQKINHHSTTAKRHQQAVKSVRKAFPWPQRVSLTLINTVVVPTGICKFLNTLSSGVELAVSEWDLATPVSWT